MYRTGLSDSCTQPSHRSVANHRTLPDVAFARYPSAHQASSALAEVWASPLASRLAVASGRIAFVIILRTDGSPPVAPDPASRRRRYLQLQAGERRPGGDLHPSD